MICPGVWTSHTGKTSCVTGFSPLHHHDIFRGFSFLSICHVLGKTSVCYLGNVKDALLTKVLKLVLVSTINIFKIT